MSDQIDLPFGLSIPTTLKEAGKRISKGVKNDAKKLRNIDKRLAKKNISFDDVSAVIDNSPLGKGSILIPESSGVFNSAMKYLGDEFARILPDGRRAVEISSVPSHNKRIRKIYESFNNGNYASGTDIVPPMIGREMIGYKVIPTSRSGHNAESKLIGIDDSVLADRSKIMNDLDHELTHSYGVTGTSGDKSFGRFMQRVYDNGRDKEFMTFLNSLSGEKALEAKDAFQYLQHINHSGEIPAYASGKRSMLNQDELSNKSFYDTLVKEASAENPTGTFRSGNEFRDYPIAKGISTIEGQRGIDPRGLTYNGRSGDLIGFSEVERLLGKAEANRRAETFINEQAKHLH